jgi:putative endonuclease
MAGVPGWRQKFGRAGEAFAEQYLRGAGLAIVARRYRRAGGEVDLVARDGRVLVFVEVKTRRPGRHGTAIEAVSHRKQRRLVAATRHYLRETGESWRPVRFDVVAVSGDSAGRLSAYWVRDAFRP